MFDRDVHIIKEGEVYRANCPACTYTLFNDKGMVRVNKICWQQ